MLESRVSMERPLSPVSSASTADVTAGHDVSTINRTLDVSFFHDEGSSMDRGLKHWIRVSHLDPSTTSKSLKCMFYPYGGDDAFVLWDGGMVGYVGFDNKFMAELALEKMNAFIPCHQSQALHVVYASLDEVFAAKSAASSSCPVSLISLLYADCPVKFLTQAMEAHKEPQSCASELVEEVSRAPRSLLSRVLTALGGVKPDWSPLDAFRAALVKELLRHIMEEDSPDHAANCGSLLGGCFVIGFLPGDPFHLATRILQRGVRSAGQMDNICAIAHTCAAMPYPISKASFWAAVGQTSLQVPDPLQTVLRAHLRRFQQSTELLHPSSATQPRYTWRSSTEDDAMRRHMVDSKPRTVYISHLPPQLSSAKFADLLAMYGVVNKVRICRGSGYATLFAFVEMSTVEEAKSLLRLSRATLMGCSIRVQIARNPVQDAFPEDAVVDCNGFLTRCCLFGHQGGTLIDALAACEKAMSK